MQLMASLDLSVVNVALPAIRDDLGFGPDQLSWVVNAYTLVYGGCLLLGGRLGDVLGRRTVLLAGLVLFALASLAGGLAQQPGQLIAARAAQGLGAALLTPPSANGNDQVPEGCVEPGQPDQESRSIEHEAGTNINAVTCIKSVKEA